MKQKFNFKKVRFFFSLFLLFSVIVASAQSQKTITGTVLSSEDNSPLPGSTVLEKGTSNGTSTDFDGNFSIDVDVNATTLVISFVGFGTKQVAITDLVNMNITLVPDAQQLDEVVVTALGIKREEKALGYAVQDVSGEDLQKVSGVDVATSLTGKVAGLLVKNSTDFGAIPTLTIRGEEPLLVIDGIAYANKTLSDISSEDIESLTVLKGATASALYGSRGSSGAILVTTKNGSDSVEGLSVGFATNTMFTAGFLAIPEKQAVYGRGSNGKYNINSTSSWGPLMDGHIETQRDPILMEERDYEYLPVGKDNFNNFLEQGYVTNNNFSVGYNTKNSSIRSSVNWVQNKGQYPNSKQNKYTYTLGGNINIDKFTLNSNVAYSRMHTPNIGSNGYTSYDPMYSLLIWSAADYNISDYKDNYWIKKDEVQNHTYIRSVNNPYFDRYEKTNEVSRDIFNADLSLSYDITDWLKATVRSGLDFYTDRGQLRTSKGSYVNQGNTGVPGQDWSWNGTLVGGYNTGQTKGFSMNNDLLLTGDKAFGDFNIEYLAGGTIFYDRYDNMVASTVGGISIPAFFSLAASVEPAKVAETQREQQVNSLFGRLAFSWNRIAFLEVTGRNDWNSTLPENTRSYFYPSVAGSFVISELLAESTRDWLDLLKIRGSWTTSKTPAKIYEVNPVYTIHSGTWNDENGASAPTTLYSETINPESFTTSEVGLKAMFFKNRLMFDLTYYDKHMFDILKSNAPVSSASGYNKVFINIDEERSRRGWEIALTGTPLKNEDWRWDLGFNWSTFKTIYTKLDPVYTPVKPWIKEGGRVDALNSREFLRVPETGELIYYNGRIKKSSYDTNFGWKDPDWLWGLNSSLSYKNFSLYLAFDGVVGGIMNTRTESYMWQSGGHPDSLTDIRALDVATPGSKNYLGDGVMIVSGTVEYDNVGNIINDTRVYAPNDVYHTYQQSRKDLHASSAWGGNGTTPDTYSKTFFKLREMSLTYNFPRTILKDWAKVASASFVGQNVMLWAKDFKYSDPDGGHEDFSDPSVRYLGFNIKVTF
jgi:TonB-linked SusC/RagA family outer membrane protein